MTNYIAQDANGNQTFIVKAKSFLSAFDKLPTYYKFLSVQIMESNTGLVKSIDQVILEA
jgi:hypothetical protein